MTNIETLVRSELDRRYPRPAGEPDWDNVLQRAAEAAAPPDRPVAILPSRRRRWRLVFALAATLLAVAAASLALVAPWKGSPGLLQQALAAIGSGRYVHAVFQSTSIVRQVDLASGNERPLPPSRRVWVDDTKTGANSVRAVVDGIVMARTPPPDPAISGFATGYRTALANGKARVVGTTTVRGEKAVILRFTTPFTSPDINGIPTRYPAYEDVAVSTAAHTPLRVTYWSPHDPGGPISPTRTWRVLAIDSSDTRPTLPKPLVIAQPVAVSGFARYIRQLAVSATRAAFGHTPVWPGRVVAGTTPLRSIELDQLTTNTTVGNMSSPLGLQFDYRGPRGALTVQESAKPEAAYGFLTPKRGLDLYTIPAEGQALLACEGCHPPNSRAPHPIWHAQLRTHGLYITIRSPRRSLVVTAARELAPMR